MHGEGEVGFGGGGYETGRDGQTRTSLLPNLYQMAEPSSPNSPSTSSLDDAQ